MSNVKNVLDILWVEGEEAEINLIENLTKGFYFCKNGFCGGLDLGTDEREKLLDLLSCEIENKFGKDLVEEDYREAEEDDEKLFVRVKNK